MRWICTLTLYAASLVLSSPWLASALTQDNGGDIKYPVVLVPGLAGSVLDAKLNRTKTVSWFCSKRADWRVIFLSVREVLSPECLCDELRLYYDADSQRYDNQKGVDIRPHDFGGTEGVAALDPSSPWLTATYLPLIKALEAAGYKERETMWGAPYDWRLAVDGLEARGAADDMQDLIEEAYATAGDKQVVLVAHSMGTLVASYFMQLWGDAWCQKHIKHMVAVSGPWGGSVNSLKASVSGDNFQLYFPHDLLHTVQGTSPSGPWLFPSSKVWDSGDVLVRTRKRNYTAEHFEDLLEVLHAKASPLYDRLSRHMLHAAGALETRHDGVQDTGLHQLSAMYPKLLKLHEGQLQHGFVSVPLTCVHGNGTVTDQSYFYDVDELNAETAPEPKTTQDKNGDGTVSLRSLQACARAAPPHKPANVIRVNDSSHIGILSTDELQHVLQDILEIDLDLSEPMDVARRGALDSICQHSLPQLSSWWRTGLALRSALARMLPPGLAHKLRRPADAASMLQRSGVCK